MGRHAYLNQFALDGRIALITGSSRGLGWEIAHAMAGCGAHVVLNGRDEPRLRERLAQLHKDGLQASIAAFDVTDIPAMKAAFQEIFTDHGRLDILVGNVGARHRQLLQDFSDADIAALVNTNLTASLILAREAAALMLPHSRGRLINITSIAGHVARAGDAVYTAAKAGLIGMVRALAAEYGPRGITSNAIAPGGFATEANTAMLTDPKAAAHFAVRTPLGRWGRPEEIAGAAVFLASDAASYVNGHVLTVDGGMTIAM